MIRPKTESIMEPTSFHVVNPPKLSDYSDQNDLARRLALKLREHRLFALKTNPEAFAASYEMEAQRGLDQSLERLSNLQADHFIAVDRDIGLGEGSSSDDYFERLIEARWLGMMVLIKVAVGPNSQAISAKADPITQITGSHVAEAAEPLSQSCAVLHYHLTGTFVHPDARKKGVGEALITAILTKAELQAQDLGFGMRCTVLVDRENASARRLYEKAGFQLTGEEAYVQQPREQLSESVVSQRRALHLQLVRAARNEH